MMKKIRLAGAVTLLTLITTIGCKRTVYRHPDDSPPSYYLPLQVGKYAIYQLDSLNFYYYGQLDTITRYLAKDAVEDSIVDNLGHVSYMVVRYLSPASGPTEWTPSLTMKVTPSSQSVQVLENNLRYIKLAYPMKEGLTWSGNSFLPDDPYQDLFDYTSAANRALNTWTYTYQNVNQPFTAGNQTYDSTVTVLQDDDSTNIPILIDSAFATRTYWTETYAKNVGLIYRKTIMWDRQPAVPHTTQGAYKVGFELTITLLEHN